MKRILFLSPYPENCAPSQRLKYEQYFDMLRSQGFHVETSPFVSLRFWKILYKEGHFFFKMIFTLLGYLRRIRDIFRLHKYDIVYVHLWATPIGPPWFERLVRANSKRLIYDIDDMIFLGHHSDANKLFRFLKGREKMIYLMKRSDHVITCTPKLDEVVRRYNENTTDISSTIDTDAYIADEGKQIRKEEIVLGWSGSHSTSKYLHLLDEVLLDLSSKYNIKLKVIGDPNFDIPGVNVEAISWTEKDEVKELKTFDIGLYPLPDEEWVYGKSGLKALQYMALGIPTIATAIGANFRVIEDGVSGSLVKPGDTDGWIKSIEALITDAQKYKSFSNESQIQVDKKYSLKANLGYYISVLNYKLDMSILIPTLEKGGAEKVAALTANHLAENLNIEVVLLGGTIMQKTSSKVKIVRLNNDKEQPSVLKMIGLFSSSRRYRKYIRRKQPKYSVSFLNRPNFINVNATQDQKNVTTIICERSYPPEAYKKASLVNWLTRFLIKRLYDKSDLIVSNSQLSTNYFKKIFPHMNGKIQVWNNPIELKEKQLPRKLDNNKKTIKLLNIGRLDTNKNQELLIRSLGKLKDDRLVLDIVGKGEKEKFLKNLVSELGLQNQVFFHGQIDDTSSFYIDADIFLLSSFFEGLPNVILEAMKFGVPVISTDCKSGPREIFGMDLEKEISAVEKTQIGVLVEQNSISAMADAIKMVLNDPEVYYSSSINGIARVKNFEKDKVLNQFSELISLSDIQAEA